MSFLQKKSTWSNAEFIPFKLCIASAYALLGAYFHTWIARFKVPVLILFAITVVWTLSLWIRNMKRTG